MSNSPVEGHTGLYLVVPRLLDVLGPAVIKVRDFALGYMDDIAASEVELALAEALTNSIKHGEIHDRNGTDIGVKAEVDAGWLTVEVLDSVPVVPEGMLEKITEHSLNFELSDLDAIPESGRGLALIVLSMDEVSLHTMDEHFSLRMRKRLPEQ